MNKYDEIKDDPGKFQKLTGFTTEEFLALLPIFTTHFLAFVSTKTLDGQERKKNGVIPLTKIVVCQIWQINFCLF